MNAIADLGYRAVEGTRLMLLNIGLLILRLGAGGSMAYAHGWAKLYKYLYEPEKVATFADPLGVGSTPSLFLAIGAELVCGVMLALGLFTRINAVPLIITMAVAAFVVHSGDPYDKREMAVLFLTMYLAIALTGPGRYSLDALLFNRRPTPKA